MENTQALSFGSNSINVVANIEKLAAIEREAIESLVDQSPEEVLVTRRNAKMLSSTAWRVECACDAEIVSRAENRRKGRGFVDIEAVGVMSAVRKRAKQIGVTPTTVFKNAQIHRLITAFESAHPEKTTSLRVMLDERGYFVSALTAADPVAALSIFISKKQTLSRFRVTDSKRFLLREGLTKKAITTQALSEAREQVGLTGRAAEIDHVIEVISQVRANVIPACPNPDIRRIHESYIEELDNYTEEVLFNKDVALVLRRAWKMGNKREQEMSNATGFPVDVVHREMLLLSRSGEFTLIMSAEPFWHLNGEPLPREERKCVKQTKQA